MLSTSRSRIIAALALGVVLCTAWGLLRALGPAYGSDLEGTWDISVTPPDPRVGDVIEVRADPIGPNSPFLLNLHIEQDDDYPAVEPIDNQGGYGSIITFDAVRPGTVTISGTGFFEKPVCPTPGSDFCFPLGFYLTTHDIVIEVSPSETCGDANGDGIVNSLDATFVLQYVAGLIVTIIPSQNLDVNGDAIVDSRDAALILQYAAGMTAPPDCGAT